MTDAVPTVDIGDPTSTSLAGLRRACADHGFFLLAGHDLDGLIARTWAETERFFGADREVRLAVERTAESPLGFFDRELTKRRRDHKAVFDFIDPAGSGDAELNRWPEHLDGFRETMTEFFAAFADLAARTLDLVQATLDVEPEVRRAHRVDPATSSVRLNHYPVGDPVPETEREGLTPLGDVALGHHTDPGVITLLLQDDTGGLQAQSRDGGWIDVPPRPGTVVVNLADAMQVWTNDRYRAAVHRVAPMAERDRYSIPFFGNPPGGCTVAPIPALAGDRPRYRPFVWSDFMRARTEDNYEDLGAADAQISDYAIDS